MEDSRPIRSWLAPVALVVALALAYANSLHGPFVFDDTKSIPENASIRRLGSAEMFFPPTTATVSGRPVVNVSLALNYALGGENVRGYHIVNVVIHALAALTLFGLLRRTVGGIQQGTVNLTVRGNSPVLEHGQVDRATPIAFAATLLWALHPLQTESVTYVIQRAESLMGLFYLLTLYAFARSVPSPGCHPMGDSVAAWRTVSVSACLLGMATKEVMVTAPLVVLLYDRVFVAGSLAAAWRQRRGFYLALASTWVLLAILVLRAGDRAGTAGLFVGATPWSYALAQCGVVLRYLRLVIWPDPLVFDYGPFVAPGWREAAPAALGMVVLLVGLVVACRSRPRVGFVVAFVALTLAPTSSVLPIVTEVAAEHRMYLALAGIAALVTVALAGIAPRHGSIVLCGAALVLGGLTWQRNRDYATERALWTATVEAVPGNPRAHYSLALALADAGDFAAAETRFKAALGLNPGYIGAREGYADLLLSQRRSNEATEEYRTILRAQPENFVAHSRLGTIAFEAGDFAAAVRHFQNAVRLRPASAGAHNNLGCAFYEQGNWAAARTHEAEAVRLEPGYAEAHYNLANTLNRLGHLAEARAAYARALALRPDYAEAHINLAGVLERTGDRVAAIEHYRAALRLVPGHAYSRQHLDALLASPAQR